MEVASEVFHRWGLYHPPLLLEVQAGFEHPRNYIDDKLLNSSKELNTPFSLKS